jgi:prepilin signal peptidase PulO-like enzyme (type II secretory pathway)
MVLIAIYFGFVLALFAFYAARALPKKGTDRYIPMGPYMALSLFIFLIWGNEIVQLYLDMVI